MFRGKVEVEFHVFLVRFEVWRSTLWSKRSAKDFRQVYFIVGRGNNNNGKLPKLERSLGTFHGYSRLASGYRARRW